MLVVALTSFLSGVLIASFVGFSQALLWGALCVIGFMFLVIRSRRAAALVLIVSCGVLVGYVRFFVADRPSELEASIGQQVRAEGYVAGDFKTTVSGGQFVLYTTQVDGASLGERILVRTGAYPRFSYGDSMVLEGTLELPRSNGEFDYVSYLKKEGVRTLINRPTVEERDISLSAVQRSWYVFRRSLIQLRDFVANGIRIAVPEPASAYLNGILLGLRQDLPSSLTDAFARTGTTHVLAISGYNVAIVAYGLMFVCLRFASRKTAVWLAVIAIGAFALLTGATASVIRAAIMGSLVLLAGTWGLQFRSILLILGAACFMVVVNPFVLRYDIGFQLSFAAVAGIIYLSPLLHGSLKGIKALRPAWEIISATVAAQIATLPLILYHFGTLSLFALPANALILPIVPLAMALGAGTSLLAQFIPSYAGVIGIPAWAVAEWQLSVVRFFARLPGASMEVTIPWYAMVLAYGVLGISIHWYGNLRNDSPTA